MELDSMICDTPTALRFLASACERPVEEEWMRKAADEIERLRVERRWISVSERLPEGDVRVLVLVNGAADIACLNWQYGWMYEDYGSLQPTHWMPLPEPPEVK